jgi:hypothetical protein
VPRPHSIPSSRLSVLRTFRRMMKLTALFAIVVAAIAVLLVATGSRGPHIYTLVTTALAAGLIVLLAGALISLMFLRAGGGHDAEATLFEEEDNQ